ncbi:MAG TPA: hypothetical protein VLF60_05220 [Candidatus Saccharimonadales bacterium]|nr:hypothetical protein [Candidatus Saccharimonadales bacterium]
MKKRLKKSFLFAARGLIFAFCGGVSIFLLMTGYESIYNRDVPFVHSLDAINLTAYQSRYNLNKYVGTDSKQVGNFGKPTNVKMPRRSMRFDIVKPIQDTANNQWLARASTLHLLPLTAPRNGNLGVALLYCRSSFRTLNASNLPNVGDNLFIDTDRNWRYVYRVTDTRVLPDDQPYILSDDGTKGKVIISCNDSAHKRNFVVEADQLVVQGVEQ